MTVRADSHLGGLWNTMRIRAYGILDDEALVSRARNRDTLAFDALVTRYRDRLYAMAIGSLGNGAEATEAICEAARSAFRDIDSVGPGCSPGAWLYLHTFRAVFQRLNAPPGSYTVARERRHALVRVDAGDPAATGAPVLRDGPERSVRQP